MTRGNPNYTGHNPDYRQLPSEFWSAEDWAAAEASERLYEPLDKDPVAPPPAYELPANFGGLHGNQREASGVDFVLQKLGIRPRQR